MKKRSFLHRAVEWVERFLQEGAIWVATVCALGLALIQIPGINDIADKLANNTELRVGVFALLLASILWELHQVKLSVTPAIGRQQFATTRDMYTTLEEKASAIGESSRRSLDVLGLTLFRAWPELTLLLERAETEWAVRVATLAHDSDPSGHWVPTEWQKESSQMLQQVADFKAGKGKRHHHKIDVYEYRFSPAVHGFRLGNEDLFMSTLLWEEDGGWLSKSNFAYYYVPGNDTSPWAASMRELFDNWFDRALASGGNGGVERAPSPDAERTV